MHTRRCFAAPNRQQFYLEFDINQLAFLKSVTISTSKHQEAKNARAPPKNAPTSPTDEGTIYKYNRYLLRLTRRMVQKVKHSIMVKSFFLALILVELFN